MLNKLLNNGNDLSKKAILELEMIKEIVNIKNNNSSIHGWPMTTLQCGEENNSRISSTKDNSKNNKSKQKRSQNKTKPRPYGTTPTKNCKDMLIR